jgi:peptide/nickel transport system substrate-binding protein
MNARRWIAASVTICVAGSLAAGAPRPALAQSGPVDTLRVAITEEPGTLDPIVGTLAVESDMYALLFSGLTRYDDRGNQIPDLAERVPTRANGGISADGKTITYHLVRNARWHDGVPVTSDDVKFTFDALMNPKNNVVNREPYDEMARVETPDPYTVRIVLKRPWAPAIDGFSNRVDGSIVPAHLLRKLADVNHADFNTMAIGSGPYKLVAWHHGSDMVFAADPAYFRGTPKIPHIIVRFLQNDNTMLISLRTHDVDVGDTLNISTFANLRDAPGLVPVSNAKSFWEHLTFNTAHPPLDDRRVRLALCYGLDVHEIFTNVFHGLGALAPGSINPRTSWYDQHVGYYPFDPKRAATLLEAAGWKMGSDGIRVRDGQRLALTFISTAANLTRAQTMVILQQRWKAIGVDVAVKTFPAATMFALAANGGPLYGGKFDVALSALIQQTPDPNQLNVNTDDAIPPNGNNTSFYHNAELTHLENAAAQTFDVAARKRMYDRIQEIVEREVPYYTLNWLPVNDVHVPGLEGVRPTIVNSTFWNIASWQFRR